MDLLGLLASDSDAKVAVLLMSVYTLEVRSEWER